MNTLPTGRSTKSPLTLGLSIAGCAGLILIAGCAQPGSAGEGTLDRVLEESSITIGLADDPPYSGVDTSGELIGMAPQLTRAVMDEMGVDGIEPVVASYAQLVPGLDANRWDMVGGLLSITAERCPAVEFSEPVIVVTSSLAVPVGNPEGVANLQDASDKGLRIGTVEGSSVIASAKNAGIDTGSWLSFPDQLSSQEALAQGRIDVYLSNTDSLNAALKEGQFTYDLVLAPEIQTTFASMAFRKGDVELRDAFNKAYAVVKEEGIHDELLEKWGFQSIPAEYVDLTADEICEQVS